MTNKNPRTLHLIEQRVDIVHGEEGEDIWCEAEVFIDEDPKHVEAELAIWQGHDVDDFRIAEFKEVLP